MKQVFKIFFTGMMVSFLGTLPLGTLNVAALQISVQESIANALYFALGCLLVEMLYIRISLLGIDWIRKQQKIMKAMEWIALGIVIALAIGSFLAASKGNGAQKNVLLQNQMHRFLLGLFMSAINPVQIPFWFGWSTVLFERRVLQTNNSSYNAYIVGIGIGTAAGNCVFIFGGKWMADRIANSQQYINWIIGGIFALTAIIMLVKILLKKDAISKMSEGSG
jgi:threonine/homoserine/homoserine lactone efflux protein